MAPTGSSHILQIHPTRRCNLRCLHCYSSSGPEEREELPASLLRDAITDAAAAGYDAVGFSGGEPLLYKPLPDLLQHARGMGMRTTVTSNGMLLDERRLEAISEHTTVLAISLDGMPESHDRMRANPRAFSTMTRNLPAVRMSGIPFGFIFTLTQFNLNELAWVVEFAVEQGARLLQIHPLEAAGRAIQMLPGHTPDEIESSFALLAAARAQAAGERIVIQVDVADRNQLQSQPARVFASGPPADAAFAELLSPLVIEPDGAVVPLQYGFDRSFALGNLRESRLNELMDHWRETRCVDFYDLCHRVFGKLAGTKGLAIGSWYEHVALEASLEAVAAAG